jgi:2-polyprenyl-3-methyl-5-hydroxy-6-metoxy-1,4-benzoquinol methylase
MDVTCRICGSRNVELFLDLGEQPHCNRLIPPALADRAEPVYPLRTGFCFDCTLVQIDHTIPKESMFSDYPYVSGTTRTLVQHFKDTAERLAATYHLKAGDLVVDIGSNDGSFLAQYQPLGLTVQGVEAAANVARLALDRGVDTLVRFFNEETANEILDARGPARLVTAAGVFFHLEELHSVVRGIHRLIGEAGVFVVQAIYLGGMVENLAFDQIYHEHLCYYTLRSLEALFARHGLAVFDVRLVPIHGGTIEVHVARAGFRPEQPSVATFRAEETSKALGVFETYQAFGRRVWTLGDELLSVLRDFKAQGRSVHAFGAPAKGATLLNSFKIGPDLVPKAVEKNPMKIGMMIPGCRIPIVGEDEDRPDAYLMLAWNFLAEFLDRERPYLDQGGAFIVPVPAVRVITGESRP